MQFNVGGIRARRVAAAALLIAALAPALPVLAFRQGPGDPSPASGGARVMAQGVVDLGDGQLAWRVTSNVAEPPANAIAEDVATGFLVAGDSAIIVEDVETGEQVRLANGEAMLTHDGSSQLRVALGATASTYYAIGLEPAEPGAKAPEDGFLSPAFNGAGGRHDVDLVGVGLGASQALNVPAGAGLTLVLVTAGSAEVATEKSEFIPLAAGEAQAIDGAVTVTGYDGGADVAIAVIGPAVPRLSAVAPQAASEGDQAAAGEPAEAPGAAETPPASEEDAQPVDTERNRDRGGTPAAASSGVDPNDPDGDGLTNAEEDQLNTDPGLSDTDGDGLNDGREVNEFGTMPLAADSDGDGINDFDEFAEQILARNGTPASGVIPTATLPPVMVDSQQPVQQGDQGQASSGGGGGDSDGDGLTDDFENQIGTDPFASDSDSDNASDGEEWNLGRTGPLNPDDDRDGKLDGDEIHGGTDPNDPSS